MANSQSNREANAFPPDVLVALDRGRPRSLRAQLEAQLRRAIQTGRFAPGQKLPPSRTLAADLGVSRNVVVEAYAHLAADGYLAARQGSATEVAANGSSERHRGRSAEHKPAAIARFFGGLPDPALFPRAEWQRHYRAVLHGLPDASLGYPGPSGALALRDALCSYLSRVRGVISAPEDLLITSGFTQALALIVRALKARGIDAIAVEDPCFGFHREGISVAGLRPVPIPVDEDGLQVDRLAQAQVSAVLLSPAHSYPSGAVLSPPRRSALVAWARARDALIVEDDYDAEFRYDRAPVGALQGLAPEHVLYAGCASKTLSPALRLGWVAAPPHLRDELVREKVFNDMGGALLEQLAFARFLEGGGFARHLRRVRPVYRRRRDAVIEALSAHAGAARATGAAAGLHLFVRLPDGCDEQALLERAKAGGVLVEPAAWHFADSANAPPALVLGYGALGEAAIRRGIEILGAAISSI